MTLQYVIIGIIVAACVVIAVRYMVREWRENVRYKKLGCAGCAFYEKCKRNKKQPLGDGKERQNEGQRH